MWAGAALFAALASGKSGTTATWAATVPLVANLALRAASGGSPPPPFAAVFGVLCVAGAYLGYKNAFA